MYLKDLKNIAMQLIDEYSTEKSPTEDEDIKQKLNGMFNAALFEVAQIKKILKVYQFSITEELQLSINQLDCQMILWKKED